MRWFKTGAGSGGGGAGSFRRKTNLHKELRKARRLIDQLKRRPTTTRRQQPAAQGGGERAAREREGRVAKALEAMAELEAQRERRHKTNKKETQKQQEPRASTTIPRRG